MSDARPTDSSQPDPLRDRLEIWVNQHDQALLDEVMTAWQQALRRLRPDEALLGGLRDTLAGATTLIPAEGPDAALASGLDLLEGASSQGDLLKRLLDALLPFVERSALFILKQGLASLYAQRGFEADPLLRAGAVVPPPELEALIQGLMRSLRKRGPAYGALLVPLSSFEASEAAIFPIHHRKKTVALLLVDSGLRNRLDHPEQVRALVHAASALLASLATGKEEEPPPPRTTPAAPPVPLPSAATQRLQDPIEPPPPVQNLDPRTRAAAERLARVLVGDVELYFPEKVAQGRSTSNLYGLLRGELERSRATFVERFGEDVERQSHIFVHTLVQQLCDGDPEKLGAHPWG